MLRGFRIFFPFPLTRVISSPCSTTLSPARKAGVTRESLQFQAQIGPNFMWATFGRVSVCLLFWLVTSNRDCVSYRERRAVCLFSSVLERGRRSWARLESWNWSPTTTDWSCFFLPGSGSVRGLLRVRPCLAGRGTGSSGTFSPTAGSAATSRSSSVSSFSCPYYSPDIARRSL